jgi:DNA-binding transcriptional ArsR family regulator
VWRALDGRTAVELSALLGLKQHSAAKHLAKLRAHDLAACRPEGRWRRLDNLDAAAKRLGIAGEGERQGAKYQRERELYNLRGESRTNPTRLVAVRDTTQLEKL